MLTHRLGVMHHGDSVEEERAVREVTEVSLKVVRGHLDRVLHPHLQTWVVPGTAATSRRTLAMARGREVMRHLGHIATRLLEVLGIHGMLVDTRPESQQCEEDKEADEAADDVDPLHAVSVVEVVRPVNIASHQAFLALEFDSFLGDLLLGGAPVAGTRAAASATPSSAWPPGHPDDTPGVVDCMLN